jgi:hypothetical protein
MRCLHNDQEEQQQQSHQSHQSGTKTYVSVTYIVYLPFKHTCISQHGRQRAVMYNWSAFVEPSLHGKSNKHYTFWVCVCSLRYPACNAHAQYCRLRPVRLYNIFLHDLTKGTIFEKENVLNTKCALIFSTLFIWNISHSQMNWARYDQKCTTVLCKVLFILVRF